MGVRQDKRSSLAVVGLLLAITAAASAQHDPHARPVVTEPPRGLLAGPAVPLASMGDAVRPFNRTSADRPQVSFQQWMGAVQALSLGDRQRTTIESLARAHRGRQIRFANGPRVELRRLRAQLAQTEATGSVSPEVLERIREIQAQAPNPLGTQRDIWKELTDDQRDQLRRDLA